MGSQYTIPAVDPPAWANLRPAITETTTDAHGVMEPGEFGTAGKQIIEMFGDHPNTPVSRSVDGAVRRSTQAHTRWLTPDDAADVAAVMPSYNAFDPADLVGIVERLKPDRRVRLGREGSPVAYVWTDAAASTIRAFDDLGRAPDELGAYTPELYRETFSDADALTCPCMGVGKDPTVVGDGDWALVRAWWD